MCRRSPDAPRSLPRRALLALPLLATPALAQTPSWPADRPIEMIVPYPPGGGVDMVARFATQQIAPRLPGARFVVSNRPGAGGQIGNEAVFNAAPDGYTLGTVGTLSFASLALDRPVRWRMADFTYIANIVDDPTGIWVLTEAPWRDLGALVEEARRAPERVAIGSAAGIGSDDHQIILGLELAAEARFGGSLRFLHAPYNGTALVQRDLLSGAVPVATFNMSEGLALMRQGKVRALGQAAEARWPGTPEVPTLREQGFDVLAGSARGIVGPPGIPAAITERLVGASRAAFADPTFTAEAEKLGLPLRPLLGAAYRDAVIAESARLKELFDRRPWSSR